MSKPATQSKLGARLGATQPSIAHLTKMGVLTPGADLDQWTREAWAYMSESAAGRQGPLADERTRLAARQSEKLEIELAKLRSGLAPAAVVAEKVFIPFINATKTKIRKFPTRCSSMASLTPPQIEIIERLTGKLLNEVKRVAVNGSNIAAWLPEKKQEPGPYAVKPFLFLR
jgi:hypothetical protein